MMRTKKESEKGRKKVVRTGSKSFIAGLSKGDTVRVTWKDWINYWASVQDPNRERYQRILEEREQEIEYLRDQLKISELSNSEADTKLIQERSKNAKLAIKHEEHIAKISQLEAMLVAVLTPWAYSLGPRKLVAFIEEQKSIFGIDVSLEACDEVIAKVFTSVAYYLEHNPGSLNGAHDILMEKFDVIG